MTALEIRTKAEDALVSQTDAELRKLRQMAKEAKNDTILGCGHHYGADLFCVCCEKRF